MEHKIQKRKQMAEYALEHGVSASACFFKTTRKTVGKWRNRYLRHGDAGLVDHPNTPKTIPHKIAPELEAKIIAIRQRQPDISASAIQKQFGVTVSAGTIYRVLREAGLVGTPEKKR